MTFIGPIRTPVTGAEDCADPREPRQALAQFYRALNTRDLALMEENWTSTAEAAMDNPLGGIKRGWSEIRGVYEKLFAAKGPFRIEFGDYTLHETGDIFYVVGRERGEIETNGETMPLAFRTSRIFRREAGGKWRQIHHHGSMDDPQALARYQEAVLGKR